MIRKWRRTDLDAISLIWLETNIKAHDFIAAEYWQQQLPAVKEMLPQADLYLWESEGQIKGFMGLMDNYIAGIFVLEEAQGQGIGKQLLDYAKNISERLVLKVYEKNQGAMKFYKREGFRIESRGLDESTGETEYEMQWEKCADKQKLEK